MVLEGIYDLLQDQMPLRRSEMEIPGIQPDEVLLKVSTCGVCHTEIDEIEGRTPPPYYPMILGHQVVGHVVDRGSKCLQLDLGDRVGVAWIFSACEHCDFCINGFENLCTQFKATGRDMYGGYAEYMAVKEDFAHMLPQNLNAGETAPLLCAGAIGYRSVALTNLIDGQSLGLTGFGSSGHLVLKMVKHQFPNTEVFVFARSKDEQNFAKELGAVWTGDTAEIPPINLDAIIDTTPVWKPVVKAMQMLKPGGRLVINAIRKENIDQDYLQKLKYPTHLWMEKEIKSVANVTRHDVRSFLKIASEIPLKPEFQTFSLDDANQALWELKNQKIRGSKVLFVS